MDYHWTVHVCPWLGWHPWTEIGYRVSMADFDHLTVSETVPRLFRTFATECRESSPLYARLATGIADDPEILALAAHSRRGERVPNLLFAAVRFLLLKGPPHPLAGLYGTDSSSTGDPYPPFRDFCLEHAERIVEIIATRTVQTNEVRRCALLLPAFVLVSREAKGRPLYLLEIGAAAGLILLWDRYGYDYGNGLRPGDTASPVQIRCEMRGTSTPDVPTTLPAVERRIGVDLNPIDVDDTEQTLWLRSLVWPEEGERARLLENAITVARGNKPDMVAGDGIALLPELLAGVPEDAALCIVRVFTNLPLAARDQFTASIAEHGKRRDLSIVSTRRGAREGKSLLGLVSYRNGVWREAVLANCDNHGKWLEWLIES